MSQQALPFWKRLDHWLNPTVTRKLSEEDELAAVLAEPPDFERRGAIRHSVGVETQCMLIALVRSDPWLVLVRDVSSTGVGFEFPCPLPVGTFIMIELPGGGSSESERMVRMKVVSARPQGDAYIIGCLLSTQLEADHVERIAEAGG